MYRRLTARIAAIVLLSAAVSTTGSLSAIASQPAGSAVDTYSAQFAAQEQAASTEQGLRASLGDAFAGAWFNQASGKLVAAVTDPSRIAEIQAAGADATVVAHSESALDAMKSALDALVDQAPSALTGWYVDSTTNTLAVEINRNAADAAAAEDFLASVLGADAAVTLVDVAQEAQPLYDVRGGDAWYGPNYRCSVGFSAVDGGGGKHFVTAGHCTAGGASAYGYNQVYLGYSNGSVFPGSDYGKVDVTSSQWTLRPWVNNYGGGNVLVRGSAEAPVGGSVCRSGSTTGWHCGTIQAKNQTVRYSQGTVYGLTRTNVCAEPGDSGGSWISGNQAQGVTSGGSGNCTSGGTTYFQPVNPALSAYGLRLVTG
jgi:streptogrisin C